MYYSSSCLIHRREYFRKEWLNIGKWENKTSLNCNACAWWKRTILWSSELNHVTRVHSSISNAVLICVVYITRYYRWPGEGLGCLLPIRQGTKPISKSHSLGPNKSPRQCDEYLELSHSCSSCPVFRLSLHLPTIHPSIHLSISPVCPVRVSCLMRPYRSYHPHPPTHTHERWQFSRVTLLYHYTQRDEWG